MERSQAIATIKGCTAKLREVRTYIIEQNEGGKQFDFVSSPQLSDAVDNLRNVVFSIDNFVYQE